MNKRQRKKRFGITPSFLNPRDESGAPMVNPFHKETMTLIAEEINKAMRAEGFPGKCRPYRNCVIITRKRAKGKE